MCWRALSRVGFKVHEESILSQWVVALGAVVSPSSSFISFSSCLLVLCVEAFCCFESFVDIHDRYFCSAMYFSSQVNSVQPSHPMQFIASTLCLFIVSLAVSPLLFSLLPIFLSLFFDLL